MQVSRHRGFLDGVGRSETGQEEEGGKTWGLVRMRRGFSKSWA